MTVAVFAYSCGTDIDHAIDRRLIDVMVTVGLQPTVVLCDGILYNSCPVMFADGVSTSSATVRRMTCTRCKLKAKRWKRDRPFINFTTLESLVDTSTTSLGSFDDRVDQAVELIKSNTSLYRKLLYSDLLREKCNLYELEQRFPREIQRSLKSGSIMNLALSNLARTLAPTSLLVHNALYGTNAAVWDFAKKSGVDVLSYYGSTNPIERTRIVHLERDALPLLDDEKLEVWNTIRTRPISHHSVTQVADFLEIGLKKDYFFSYSPPPDKSADALRTLDLSSSTRVVLALLSSPDESVSAFEVGVFAPLGLNVHTAVPDFVRLILETANKMPERTFIVRLHPRMAKTHKERPQAPGLGELLDQLSLAPSNVVIDHPDNGVSVFDLGKIADVVLSMGTTAAMQLGAMGVPVINCSPNFGAPYPLDLYEAVAEDSTFLVQSIRSSAPFSELDLIVRRFRFLDYYLTRRGVKLFPTLSLYSAEKPAESHKPTSRHIRAIKLAIVLRLRQTRILKGFLLIVKELARPTKFQDYAVDDRSKQMLYRMVVHRLTFDKQILTEKNDESQDSEFKQLLFEIDRLRTAAGWTQVFPTHS